MPDPASGSVRFCVCYVEIPVTSAAKRCHRLTQIVKTGFEPFIAGYAQAGMAQILIVVTSVTFRLPVSILYATNTRTLITTMPCEKPVIAIC
jgi:hypothetical protein